MTGLQSTVVAVFAFALLGTVTKSAYVCQTPVSPIVSQTPEKCLNKDDTGSEMSNEERQSAVDAINTYRALIANQCDKFKSGKPKSANFRKIRYACDMEKYAKFECPKADEKFEGIDDVVFRAVAPSTSTSVFFNIAPRLEDIEINESLQPKSSFNGALALRFYLNDEASAVEIGCYKKKCHDKVYLACSTYEYISHYNPLYIAGSRCQSNVDCKDPGYPICDMENGLCEQGTLPYRCGQHQDPTVRRKSEMCLDRLDTGSRMSNAERQLIVDGINLHRGFITNQCAAWGSGKPASANMLKVHYSCELEQQVKFECPKEWLAYGNWKSDKMVYREIANAKSGFSVLWRLQPLMSDVKINANTQVLVDKTVRGSGFLSFALNNDVSKVGCFRNTCHSRYEYIACTTGHPIDVTKPLYKRGNRCQKDADCTVKDHTKCDMEYGLCQGCQKDADCTDAASPVCNPHSGLCGPLTCKFSVPSLTGDACKDLRACTEATDNAEPEKQFCRSTVIIAERNSDNSFTVKGFGAAVSEKHLLSSVTSEFTKFGDTELYAIAGGTTIYQLRAASVLPEIYIGDPNFDAWADLALVELPASLKFNDYLKIKKVDLQDKSLTLQMAADKVIIKEMSLKPDAECQKLFPLDSPITYVPNKNMACGLDDNDKGTRYLSGVPLADMTLTDGKYTLHGIRSIESLDPQHSNGFLVTKLAPNCNWLSIYSGGAVKCV